MIHLTRKERTEAALRNAWAKSAFYGRIVPVDLHEEHDIVVNHFKQGISIMEHAHNKLHKDYPRLFK